jgi:hypothetical protein
MTKVKNETQLLKKAVEVAEKYAKNRGFTEFPSTMAANEKVEVSYRLLVKDKLITPVAADQETIPNMKHKLAIWISRQLPKDHPLLK